MIVKLFEIRDSMTFIPVIATQLLPSDQIEDYYLSRMGFNAITYFPVVLTRLNDFKSTFDPSMWASLTGNDRTMRVAHEDIYKNFAKLDTGDVVDVEYILGESKEPKTSERIEYPL